MTQTGKKYDDKFKAKVAIEKLKDRYPQTTNFPEE